VYFEGSPLAEDPRAVAEGAPPILYVLTFPWKYFFSTKYKTGKKSGNKKRVVYVRRGSCTHVVS